MLLLRGGLVLVSWFEGVETARFGLLNPLDGTWVRGKGIRGLVHDAIADPTIDRAWLLCSHGLFEIELSTARVLRTLRKGLGSHQRALTPLGDGAVGVSAAFGRTTSVISLDSLNVVGRMRVAAPDVVVDQSEALLFMSFETGTARNIEGLKPEGREVTIPRSASAQAVGRRVAYLPSQVSISDSARASAQSAPAHERKHFTMVFSTLRPHGSIAWYEPDAPEIVSEGPDVRAERLLAHSADGHLFALSRPDGNHARGLLVLSPDGRNVEESFTFPAEVRSVIALPDAVLVWQGRPDTWPHITALTGVTGTSGTSVPIGTPDLPLLRPPSRQPPTRLTLEHITLQAGERLTDVTAERITLRHCSTEITDDAHTRPVLSNLALKNLQIRNSFLRAAVLEDVTVDGLDTDMISGFIRGCELRRVVIRGRVGHLAFSPDLALGAGGERVDELQRSLYEQRLSDPEWMLDISEARGPIEIRGYPSRFLRLNPEIHAVVPFERAVQMEWLDVDFGRAPFAVRLRDLVRQGWEDATLIADPRSKHIADELRVIEELRRRGIALA